MKVDAKQLDSWVRTYFSAEVQSQRIGGPVDGKALHAIIESGPLRSQANSGVFERRSLKTAIEAAALELGLESDLDHPKSVNARKNALSKIREWRVSELRQAVSSSIPAAQWTAELVQDALSSGRLSAEDLVCVLVDAHLRSNRRGAFEEADAFASTMRRFFNFGGTHHQSDVKAAKRLWAMTTRWGLNVTGTLKKLVSVWGSGALSPTQYQKALHRGYLEVMSGGYRFVQGQNLHARRSADLAHFAAHFDWRTVADKEVWEAEKAAIYDAVDWANTDNAADLIERLEFISQRRVAISVIDHAKLLAECAMYYVDQPDLFGIVQAHAQQVLGTGQHFFDEGLAKSLAEAKTEYLATIAAVKSPSNPSLLGILLDQRLLTEAELKDLLVKTVEYDEGSARKYDAAREVAVQHQIDWEGLYPKERRVMVGDNDIAEALRTGSYEYTGDAFAEVLSKLIRTLPPAATAYQLGNVFSAFIHKAGSYRDDLRSLREVPAFWEPLAQIPKIEMDLYAKAIARVLSAALGRRVTVD